MADRRYRGVCHVISQAAVSAALGLFLASTTAGLASAQDPAPAPVPGSDAARCLDADQALSTDVRIGACTAVIRSGEYSGQGLEFALLTRGNLYLALRDYPRAIADYDQAKQMLPDSQSARFNLGLAKVRSRDYAGALAEFNALAPLAPEWPSVYYQRGLARSGLRDYAGAIADFTDALRLSPDMQSALVDRGSAHASAGDLDQGIVDFNAAIRMNPQDDLAFSLRGLARHSQGNLTSALADYSESLRLDGENAIVLDRRAGLHFEMNNYAGAIADYETLARLDARDASARFNLCVLRLMTDDLTGALAGCNAALAITPEAQDPRLIRGLVHVRLQDYSAAMADFTASPDGAGAALSRYGQGIVRLRQGDIEGGQRMIAEVTAEAPRVAEDLARFGVRP